MAKASPPARQDPTPPPAQTPAPVRPQPLARELNTFLKGQAERIAEALPKHLTPDRLIQVVTQIVHRTPKLQECHPTSILAAVIQASTLGLELSPTLGEAYLIPRRNKDRVMEAHFQPGFRGLAKLARNSGGVAYVKGMLVHERDAFTYRYTPDLEFSHVPYLGLERGPVSHAYAVAKLITGEYLIEVMTAEELEQIHQRSEGYKNARQYNEAEKGPWVTDRGEMEKKTVLKRLCKSLPMSPELAEAIDADNRDYVLDDPRGGPRVARSRGLAGLRDQLGLDAPALPPGPTKTYMEADEDDFDPGPDDDGAEPPATEEQHAPAAASPAVRVPGKGDAYEEPQK